MVRKSREESPSNSPRFGPEEISLGTPLAKSWEPGVVEVEFQQDVRPSAVPTRTGAASEMQSAAGTRLRSLNQILTKNKLESAEPSLQTSMEEADRAQTAARTKGIDAPHLGNFITFHFPEDADTEKIAEELNQLPEVVRASPLPTALPPATPLDEPLIGTSGQVVVDPGTGLENQWYIFRCQANKAWDKASGNDVVIADIDWGYLTTHQDLASRLDLSHAYNSYDGGINISHGTSIGHGTAVMGIAGGADNNLGMAGFAHAATLWPVQANSGPGSPIGGNAWARAIDWVRTSDSGGKRKVIILEVQTGTFGNYEMVPSVNAAIKTAIASGVVVCVAAGNGNRDAGFDDLTNPIPETGSILVGAAAYHPTDNQRAGFSNYGKRVTVAAPGDSSHDLTCSSTGNDIYRNGFGGTSGATPKVAGTVALMLEANPSLTHEEIRAMLNATGSPVVAEVPAKPVGTFLNAEAAVNTAAGKALKWYNNMKVSRAYTSYHSQNAWVSINTLGWRKIKAGSADGVTNCLIGFCEAVTNNRKVHVYADTSTVYRMQLV